MWWMQLWYTAHYTNPHGLCVGKDTTQCPWIVERLGSTTLLSILQMLALSLSKESIVNKNCLLSACRKLELGSLKTGPTSCSCDLDFFM